MSEDESNLLTTGQAAKLCSVTPDTILKWIKRGRISGTRTAGGHYRIERQALEPLLVSSCSLESSTRQIPECYPQNLRCWEYLGNGSGVRDDCRKCVVYHVRASRCFLMAGLEADVGHARQFCQSSCEDCVYYRRVNGLASNVLVITSDDEFVDQLGGGKDESVTLCFARNAYEASAIIHDFRPAFAVIDGDTIPAADTELLDSLVTDPRVPGLRIIFVVSSGRTSSRRDQLPSDLVISVLEKPFSIRQILAVINSFPVSSLIPEGSNP